MKNIVLSFFFLLCPYIISELQAIPADPTPRQITQPDGTLLTICVHGDEFAHFRTTEDGYTIVRDNRGFYVYAQVENGILSPGNVVARDISARSPEENRILSTTSKYLKGSVNINSSSSLKRNAPQDGILKRGNISSGNFHGVIILAQFTDKKFSSDDINSIITETVNQQGYSKDGFSGSVRDYFNDNSMGQFVPQFDIIGPVTLDYKQADAKGTDNGQQLVRNACLKADDLADFSKYDLNNDGEVDMTYVIFAGGGSNAGNDENFIWPHAFYLYNYKIQLDGVYCNRYACSTELSGLEKSNKRDGIGTICHEFSHVLGLPDFYDADYEENGLAPEPGNWSLMASGSYLNNSRTPCGYSLFERYAVGWATPEMITSSGDYAIEPLNTSNGGYRINSAVNKEFFILENRQNTGWDKYLPGHGMLVFRVDSTNPNVWIQNRVNNDPKHVYYELLRADNKTTASSGNPFPGTKSVKNLTNSTTPSLLSWSGSETKVSLKDITEFQNNISFTAYTDATKVEIIEDFETLGVTSGNATGLQGKYSKWDLNKAQVQTPGSEYADGEKSIGFFTGGSLVSTDPIDEEILSVSYKVWNPLNSSITTRLYYSYDNGANWRAAYNAASTALVAIDAKSSTVANFEINAEQPTVYKITMSTGNSSQMCYVDNFTLKYNGTVGITTPEFSDTSLKAYNSGEQIIILTGEDASTVRVYTLMGMLIEERKPENGKLTLTLPGKNIYIIRQNGKSIKVMN